MNYLDTINLFSMRLVMDARSMDRPMDSWTRKHIIEEWDGKGNFVSAKLFVSNKTNQGQLWVGISEWEKGKTVFEYSDTVDIGWPVIEDEE